MPQTILQRSTAAVVGSGPSGLAAALALGRKGIDTCLLATPASNAVAALERRTAALFAGSIELLKNVGAWSAIAPESEPITAIRVIDATGFLLRAPEVVFTASELGLSQFGWNIPQHALAAALFEAVRRPDSNVKIVETGAVVSLDLFGTSGALINTREGTCVQTRLVVAADGRNSICRKAAGIPTRRWTYPQTAVVVSFSHDRPHNGISTEFHRPAGPFTTVPLPGLWSSLVWVETPDEAERLMGLSDSAFREILESRLEGLLGTVGELTPRASFPLSGLAAETFGRRRVALVGEAGHVIPPIGAQGLNLGFRDAAVLADCVAEAMAEGGDAGSSAVLDAYAARRRGDVATRVYSVDILNRSLISGLPPLSLARSLGLHALKAVGPLRRFLVREGLAPTTVRPTLMQPNAAASRDLATGGQ